MSMKFAIRSMIAVLAAGFLMTAGAQAEEERNLFDDAPWYVGAGVGYYHFEGDEQVDPSAFIGARLGHDFNEFFSVELGLDIAPAVA
jgi:hypothetical protein